MSFIFVIYNLDYIFYHYCQSFIILIRTTIIMNHCLAINQLLCSAILIFTLFIFLLELVLLSSYCYLISIFYFYYLYYLYYYQLYQLYYFIVYCVFYRGLDQVIWVIFIYLAIWYDCQAIIYVIRIQIFFRIFSYVEDVEYHLWELFFVFVFVLVIFIQYFIMIMIMIMVIFYSSPGLLMLLDDSC